MKYQKIVQTGIFLMILLFSINLVSAEGDFSTLEEKINNEQTNEVNLEENYTYNKSTDNKFYHGVSIYRSNFTINGNGFTINANNESRIFKIRGENITIKNLNFINGNHYEGGAIYNKETNGLTIINCVFANNTGRDGGAILNHNSNIVINNSIFNNNTAKEGGAIQNYLYNNFKGNNNIFTNNNAKKGGAISDLLTTSFTMTNSTFTNNTAIEGGAVKCLLTNNYTVINCIFRNNNVSTTGGAILSTASTNITLIHCIFTNNTANEKGGAIDKHLCMDFIITNNTFTNNNAKKNGGAINSDNGGYNFTITNSTFTNNKAIEYGGAINNDLGSQNLTINNCTFTNNKANEGGAINNKDGGYYLIINNSTFTNNKAGENGGAINNNHGGYYLIITNSIFIKNTATKKGGGIYNSNSKYIIINDSSFTSNNATYGGAIHITEMFTDNFTINNCTFNNNIAIEDGGAIVSYCLNFLISKSTFINNQADEGGAIYIALSNSKISNNNFNNNEANYGGAIYALTNYETKITSNAFEDNYAKEGGAIYNIKSNETNIDNNEFTENHADYGGAIYSLKNNETLITINNFTNNHAKYGGAIYNIKNNKTDIDNNEFTENEAKFGGAIYNIKSNETTINNNKFTENKAAYGGSLYSIYNNNSKIDNNQFSKNTAIHEGGAIYELNNVNYTIYNNTFIENNANETGGAIANYNTINLKINNSTFIKNHAKEGEAIFNVKSDSIISQSSFMSNTTNENIIYNNGKYEILSIIDCIFKSSNEKILIYNEGNLFLEQNKMISDNPEKIYNNGTITSNMTLTILNNETIYSACGSNVNLTAVITDDNGNIIVGQNITLNVNQIGEFILSNYYKGIYNYLIVINQKGIFPVTGSYEGGRTIVKIGILDSTKKNPIFTIESKNTVYGENQTIIITFENDETGNVTIGSKTVNIINGKATFDNLGLNAGTHTLTITYNGDENYNKLEKQYTITINKTNTNFTIKTENMIYGENQTITIYFKGNETGNVTIGSKTVNIINGKATFNNLGLNAGTQTLTITYNGDENYNKLEKQYTITINKTNTNFTIKTENMIYGENQTITIYFEGNETGNITINSKTAQIINGKATISNLELSSGHHDLLISYSGDKNFNGLEKSQNIFVDKADVFLIGENISIFYKSGEEYIVTLKDKHGNILKNMTVYLTVNNITYKKATNDKGEACLCINLNPGNYIVFVNFNESENYNEAKTNNTIEVLSRIIGNDIEKYYKNGTHYYVKLLDENGKPLTNVTVCININGRCYYKTTNNTGIAKLNINLNPGNYELSVSHPITNETITNLVSVYSTINASDLTKYYCNDSQYYVKLLDNLGNPLNNSIVTMNVNGKFYNKSTNNEGIAKLDIKLNPGEYKLTVSHPINGERLTNIIKVLPTVIGHDVTMNKGENKTYDIEVFDCEGNPFANQTVIINIHGIFYNKTTKSDGKVKLNITLDSGSYIATATSNGYSTSNIIRVL
ncbi:hypothetical protein LJC03_00145 [Methanobrevibacter sp. OttesenSCG-928-I08]|nr:hypothetical protein [Methanobrevibacter sp. OttesenSCG-928-I08]